MSFRTKTSSGTSVTESINIFFPHHSMQVMSKYLLKFREEIMLV